MRYTSPQILMLCGPYIAFMETKNLNKPYYIMRILCLLLFFAMSFDCCVVPEAQAFWPFKSKKNKQSTEEQIALYQKHLKLLIKEMEEDTSYEMQIHVPKYYEDKQKADPSRRGSLMRAGRIESFDKVLKNATAVLDYCRRVDNNSRGMFDKNLSIKDFKKCFRMFEKGYMNFFSMLYSIRSEEHKKRTKSRWNSFLKQLTPLIKSAGKNDEKFRSAIKTWQEVRESRKEKINAYYSGSNFVPFGRTKDYGSED